MEEEEEEEEEEGSQSVQRGWCALSVVPFDSLGAVLEPCRDR